MQRKQEKYTFGGANQDVSKSKHNAELYYEAEHIRIISSDSQSTGSVINEKGNELKLTIPDVRISSVSEGGNSLSMSDNYILYNGKSVKFSKNVSGSQSELYSYGNQNVNNNEVIGHSETRDGFLLFTTSSSGFDAIWNVEGVSTGDYNLELLYINKLGFSKDNPIQAIYNYENENIQKVYWVDGKHQIRFINIKHDTIDGNGKLIDLPSSSIDSVGVVGFSEPRVTKISGGGQHTSGMIQYAYNLYNLNGSQTKISPLSDLVSLDKGEGNGGGEVNEVVGSSPTVKIENIDRKYNYIKVYSIKYTSYNQTPEVSLISDRKIGSSTVTILDDGTAIESISIEELIFLGSDPMIPKHIESKDNRLFPANITTSDFEMPEELDFRAYSYDKFGNNPQVLDTVTGVAQSLGLRMAVGEGLITIGGYSMVPKEHSAINVDYDRFRYTSDGVREGGEGRYLRYKLNRHSESSLQSKLDSENSILNVDDLRFFKDSEIYRIGIVFYNNLGQDTVPYWIADFKSPEGNLQGMFTSLDIELKDEFNTFISNYSWGNINEKPVGYKIVRANRTDSDKTILQQGALSNMVIQTKILDDSDNSGNLVDKDKQDSFVKYPSWLIRHGADYPQQSSTSIGGDLDGFKHLSHLDNEVFTARSRGDMRQYAWQYDKMIQMYSPEILFNKPSNYGGGLKLRVKGYTDISRANAWAEERFVNTKQVKNSGKIKGGLSAGLLSKYTPQASLIEEFGPNGILGAQGAPIGSGNNGELGFITPSGDNDTMLFKQYFREYDSFNPMGTDGSFDYLQDIYGSPEIVGRGASSKVYNGDSKYEYSNSLQAIMSDRVRDKTSINSVNSYGTDSIIIVLGDSTDDTSDRVGLEDIYSKYRIDTGEPLKQGLIISELVKGIESIYMGGVYGGNDYEDKKRTEYIKIGDYKNITWNGSSASAEDYSCYNPGDTYVQYFDLMRVGKTDVEVYSAESTQITDIIRYKTESSINLKNRNDISRNGWDSRFHPRHEEYFKYNKVYSQQPSLVQSRDVDYKFRRVDKFDTRIQASMLKIPNESIDSWTEILTNESIDLNGAHGPINNISSFRDHLYVFQDKAIALLQINPRVQVQASDGLGIELGTGGVLHDYTYATTSSGSISKWAIKPAKMGVYYYDALNKALCRVSNEGVMFLSDSKGMKTFFNNNYLYDEIKIDNPVKGAGAVMGYDKYNNDIYLTINQIGTESVGLLQRINNKSFTRVFNEMTDSFVDLKKYHPKRYIYTHDKMIAMINLKDLYEHEAGEYNVFFGVNRDSSITLMFNPNSDFNKVFDNIYYNSESYLNDMDQPEVTLTSIRSWNEYQDSGLTPLNVGRRGNIRRKFRQWSLDIPRDGRNRMRNPWIFTKLEFENKNNYKLVLHDLILNYSI